MVWWVYVIIIFVIVCILGFLLFFFQIKREDAVDLTEQSKERLDDMVTTFDILIEMAKENPKLKENISQVQDKIRYSEPTNKKKIIEKDKHICEKISDLKLKLARAKIKGTYYGCERILSEIELLLVERNSQTK